MSKKPYLRLVCLIVLVATVGQSFSQKATRTLELKFGNEASVFLQPVRIVSVQQQTPTPLKNGSYQIENSTQKATIVLNNKLINGTASETDGSAKTEYVIVNSYVTGLKSYTGDVLNMDAHKEKEQMYFKMYNINKTLIAEGTISLNKQKHYGRGITKSYFEDGTLQKISNYITETHTSFYPNGKKKAVMALDLQENYDEEGRLLDKQYWKNKVRYVEDYYEGKLRTRSYENNDKSEVKEYYQNGVLEKKEVLKPVDGEMRLFIYNRAGKLISNESDAPSARVGD